MKKNVHAIAGLAVAAGLVLSGCAPSAPVEEAPTEITIALNSAPVGGWDPTGWTWDAATPLQEAVYDSLIRITPTGFEPSLAESWEWVSPTEFEITLRDGVEFIDGEALTADVVVANLERFKNSTNRFASSLAGMTGADVSSDLELTLEFAAPVPDLQQILGQQAGRLVSPNAIADPTLFAEGPQGIAPYLVDSDATVIDVTYTLVKNPDHWDADAYPYENVTFEIQADRQASFNALLAGQIDLFWGTPDNVDAAKSSGMSVYEAPGLLLTGAVSDMAGNLVPALADVRVRQALNFAVDREAIATNVHPGQPTAQIFIAPYASNIPALDDAYPYDPDRARELLAEAGYEGFTLPVTAIATVANTATAITAYWSEIGINVELETLPANEFVAKVVAGEVAFMITSFTTQGAWNDIYALLSPTGGRNSLRFEYPQFADLLAEALAAEGSDRDAVYREIAELASEEAVTVPVVRETFYHYHSSSIGKLEIPQGQFMPSLRSLAP